MKPAMTCREVEISFYSSLVVRGRGNCFKFTKEEGENDGGKSFNQGLN